MPGHVIIVGGGSGTRMGAEMPKQFLLLGGVPIIIRSINLFLDYSPDLAIIAVVPPSFSGHMQQLASDFNIQDKITIVEGGNTRFQSVKKGLEEVPDSDNLVAVHDAVRPLVDSNMISRLFQDAGENGNAVPVIKVKDSVRSVNESGSKPVDRSYLRLVQTPQIFKASELKRAYDRPDDPSFTDCASVFEKMGAEIFISEGSEDNIKITTSRDLMLAERMLIT